MTTPFEDETVVEPVEHDSFPQPRTIPAGWDVSELFCEQEAASATEDLAGTESS